MVSVTPGTQCLPFQPGCVSLGPCAGQKGLAACPWARVLVRRGLAACPWSVCGSEWVWLRVPGWACVLVRRGLAACPWSVYGSEGVWLHAPGLYAGQKGSGCMPLVCMRVRRGLAERPWSVCGSEGICSQAKHRLSRWSTIRPFTNSIVNCTALPSLSVHF